VPVVLVTAVVFQSSMGWLSAEVLLGMHLIVVAVAVFQSPMGWLNMFANIEHAPRHGHGLRVPVADELVELEGTFERILHRGRGRRAPVADDVRARTFDLRTLGRLLVNGTGTSSRKARSCGVRVRCSPYRVAAAPPHSSLSFLSSAHSPANMPSIDVTSSVFQSPMTRLIVAAPTNVYSIVVAAAMLQSPVLEHVMHGAESARSASRRSPPRLRRVAVQFLSVVRSNVFRTSFVPIPSEVAFEGANVGADVICEVGVDVGADVVSGFSVAAPPNVFLSTLTSRSTSKSAVPV